jgi:hypothetical protein
MVMALLLSSGFVGLRASSAVVSRVIERVFDHSTDDL